uniref:Uncharacterized protein n=1 Tax=Rhizophora mucronata TaxID=61149 RepID=A0A2P2PQB6_RHIMU
MVENVAWVELIRLL